VWLLIHHRRKLTETAWVSLSSRDLTRLGVGETDKRRALKLLEAEGFIRVERARGCSTRVRLVRED
jgi:hypothetical protein